MGAFTRIRRLLAANLQEAIDRAEDPAKMLNYLIAEMRESLDQAREETATAMAAEKHLALQATEIEQAAAQWPARAQMAVSAGDDALAREALQRRGDALALAAQLQQGYQRQRQAVRELREDFARLQQRLREAQTRRSVLLAQWEVAKSEQTIAQALQQAGGESSDSFERIAGKIAETHYQAIAHAELAGDAVDDAFVQSEASAEIERELLQLKQEAGILAPPGDARALEEHARSESQE